MATDQKCLGSDPENHYSNGYERETAMSVEPKHVKVVVIMPDQTNHSDQKTLVALSTHSTSATVRATDARHAHAATLAHGSVLT
jgi:hypothetical protein